jgi:probable F420-dependent oxidoreductase
MVAMRLGIHLPQYGSVAGPVAISRAARHAEELGFDDVWVSDHTVHPAAQTYPSPYLVDPLVSLTWAAAVTERVGLGTSVLVVPTHEPLHLANVLASLDSMSGGRLVLGVGVGWSEAEYSALGRDFHTRGRQLDEAVELWRTVWRDDPASFDGDFSSFTDIRILPQPARTIPIWFGGGSERAYRRGAEKGDGFHVVGLKPDTAAPVVSRLRELRPEPEFTISLRTGWDPQGMDPGLITEELGQFAEVGIQHVVAAPWRKNLDDWLRSMDLLAELVLR